MLNKISVSLPQQLRDNVNTETAAWLAEGKIAKIWAKDASVWTNDDESKWLGWLDIIEEEIGNIDKYKAFHEDVAANFESVLLLGMGGSSLCPEVLSITFGKPNFHILDSTVPARVKAVEEMVDIDKTLFIVASKSGSTLEPNCFKQYFFDKVAERVGKENAGKQFVAITDPGSKMEQIAKDDGFRYIFYGKPSVGGRFSALSAFGLTAAASMGLDVSDLLARSKEMADACRENSETNPGFLLGVILGVCHKKDRDKLTIFTGNEIYDLGAWLEQLIAESTGKKNVAIIPVDREPVLTPDGYGSDRVFAALTIKGGKPIDGIEAIKAAGNPVVEIELDSIENIGQEFFRWEFATAVAGSIMHINTFNQPDVESAKIEARKLTSEYEEHGSLPDEVPFFTDDTAKLFSGDHYSGELAAAVSERSLPAFLNAHFAEIKPNDYFALLAYVEMSDENEKLLQAIREKVLGKYKPATCLGFGPRFLHSTGQAYKGGGNNGVFLQLTSDDAFDIPVPDQKFTFGVVKAAQARGDFQVLIDRNRRALRVHLGSDVKAGLERILGLV